MLGKSRGALSVSHVLTLSDQAHPTHRSREGWPASNSFGQPAIWTGFEVAPSWFKVVA